MIKWIIIFLISIQVSYSQSIKDLIDSSSIKYKKVAVAIAVHESNHGRSSLARKHNNLYGFKGKKGYKKYPSKSASVKDYYVFEQRVIKKYNINSRSEYLSRISRFYASDKLWLKRVKKLII